MKQNYKTIILWLLLVATLTSNAQGTEHRVSSVSQFNSLTNPGDEPSSLMPGDVVIWEDGTYDDDGTLNFKGVGTAENPITFRANTPGGVMFTGSMKMDIGGEYLITEGFHWKGGEGASNFIEFRYRTTYAQHSTIQNCVIDGLIIDPSDRAEGENPDDPEDRPSIPKHRWVVLYGNYNNVLNCTFMNKDSAGALVLVELEFNAFSNGEDDPTSVNNRAVEVGHIIDSNYFFNFEKIDASLSNAGDSETIRVGTSEYQNVNCATTVSNNYFVQADGENEIITNKSRNNIYRNNTFRRSRGSLVLRHGAGAIVEGNVFLGENVEGTGGLRIVDSDHVITNNHIQDCINAEDQAKWNNPITFMGGNSKSVTDPSVESLDNGYQKTENTIISNNTIVNSYTPIFFNGAKGQNDTKGVVSNNIIYYDSGNQNLTDIISEDIISGRGSFEPINELTFSGNIFNRTNLGQTVSGFEESSTLNTTLNGEVLEVSGAEGKGANLNGFVPFTDLMVGNGIGACFLDVNSNLIANPSCAIDVIEPTDSIIASNVSGFTAEEGEVITTVSSTLSWTAVSNNDWITINTVSGDEGTTEVTISVEDNTTFVARTGSVTFTQEGEEGRTATVSISQEALDPRSNFTLINDSSAADNVSVLFAFDEEINNNNPSKPKNNPKENALDKNFSTNWSGDGGNVPGLENDFITFDLGGAFDLTLVDFASTVGKTYEFQIWVSTTNTDTESFVNAFPDVVGNLESTTSTIDEFTTFVLPNAIEGARYVKLFAFGQPTTTQSLFTSITEIEFYAASKSLSTEENELNKVVIYPVPTKGALNVKNLQTPISKIEILNLEGKTVVSKDIDNSNENITIDTSSLASGLYVLRISNTNNFISKKIIIQQE